MAFFSRRLINQATGKNRAKNNILIPICLAYLKELVILSNGDVTICCLDAKGINTLGNVNDISLKNCE